MQSHKALPTEHDLRILPFLLLASLGLPGCFIDPCALNPEDPDCPTISDGTLLGIEGRAIRAEIDIEPNRGRLGAPVRIDIRFTQGGSQVDDIETWQAVEETGWEFVRTATSFGTTLDPRKMSHNHWSSGGGIVLSGIPAIVRYYALDSGGTRIALGDIDVNGGRP